MPTTSGRCGPNYFAKLVEAEDSGWQAEYFDHASRIPEMEATMGDVAPKIIAAAVQAAPVFLNRDATVDKTRDLIAKAAAGGAKLIVFPEVFISGYPVWLWGDQPAVIPGLEQKAFARLWQEGVDVPGPVTAQLGDSAREAGAYAYLIKGCSVGQLVEAIKNAAADRAGPPPTGATPASVLSR